MTKDPCTTPPAPGDEPARLRVVRAVIAIFLLVGVVATPTLGRVFETVQSTIAATLDWYYVLVVSGFLVFVVWLGASRFGRLRLGGEQERPRYRYLTWFAMLFTAGMGIGLVFWSVAEPLSHLADLPMAEVGSPGAAREAMQFTFFHWGCTRGPSTWSSGCRWPASPTGTTCR